MDIARALDFVRVHRYPDFPQPVVRRTRAVLWYWPEVAAWARTTGRYPKG